MSRFEAFTCSPYFNKHEEVRRLVSCLSKIYPGFNGKNCSKNNLIKKGLRSKDTDNSQLALVFTYTRRLLDQFLITEQSNKKTFENKLLLLEELRHRKCIKVYGKNLAKFKSEMEMEEVRDSGFFQNQFSLAKEADRFYILTDGRRNDPNLELKIRQLDYFYMVEKLKDAVEVHNRKNILRVSYSNRMLEGVLTEISNNIDEYEQVPALFVYYKLFQMVSNEDEQYYFEALDYMRNSEQYLGQDECIIIYNYFQNYCIKQINSNELHFLEELFQLYKLQLKKELLIDDNFLSEWHYKNIVTTAIRLKEMDWVYQFIQEYKNKLRPASQENAYRFNLASYYHAVGEYGKVLELLLRLEYSDLRYNLGAKALLLRTYYEMEEFEALNSLTASFYQYLQRNQLMADTRKDAYHNLFKFTKRVALLRSEVPFAEKKKLRQTLSKLQKDIKNSTFIFNQLWLEGKVAELEKVI
jgi:hypothetical protein